MGRLFSEVAPSSSGPRGPADQHACSYCFTDRSFSRPVKRRHVQFALTIAPSKRVESYP